MLQARQEHIGLFRDGSYRPLVLRGHHAVHAIAFQREYGPEVAVVVAPRLPWPLLGAEARAPHIAAHRWQDTELDMPPGNWRDVVRGHQRRFSGPTPLREILEMAPVALLLRMD